MPDPRIHLRELIEKFLAARLAFDAFQQSYSKAYADDEADRDFSREDVDFFGTIHEKAEWTMKSPSAEDRVDGWLDEAEFAAWLIRFVQSRFGPPSA